MNRPRASRPRIIWDLDDTLVALTQGWLAWARPADAAEAWPALGQLLENPPHRFCGLTHEAYLRSLDEFRLSAAAKELLPVPAVAQWFSAHGDRFEHHVLTARPSATVGVAADWVFRHFSPWVRHFHFVPARRAGDAAKDAGASKRFLVEEIGGSDFLVDDSERNLEECVGLVTYRLLVPQPWNSQHETLPAILGQLVSLSGADETIILR